MFVFSVQLLHKFSVRASDGPMKLLKIIKNPITDHLPVGCKKLGMSFSAKKVTHPREIVPADEPIAIVVGAMAHGQVSTLNYDWTFKSILVMLTKKNIIFIWYFRSKLTTQRKRFP